MQFSTRRRVVYFRVTDEEYESLERACVADGAHSVSEFTRASVLRSIDGSLGGASARQILQRIEGALRSVHEDVKAMHTTMDLLLR